MLYGTMSTPRQVNRVAVIGGGVAGLTAAHELAPYFDVTVFDAKGKDPEELGGKCRSHDGENGLPAEHGFRFFPGFYRNVIETMADTVAPDGGTPLDRLVPVRSALIAALSSPGEDLGETALEIELERPGSRGRPAGLISMLIGGAKLRKSIPRRHRPSLPEGVHYFFKLLAITTSCDRRLYSQWENRSWYDGISAWRFSAAYKLAFATGLTRTFVATRAEDMSARTGGTILLQLIYDLLARDERRAASDRVLDGPTSETWIGPWVNHLRTVKGVRFNEVPDEEGGTKTVDRVQVLNLHSEVVDGEPQLSGFSYSASNGSDEPVDGVVGPEAFDAYVLAVSGPICQAVLANSTDLLTYDRSVPADQRPDHPLVRAGEDHLPYLDGVFNLRFGWMSGILYYLDEPTNLPHGHALCLESPWALTAIDQTKVWDHWDDPKIKSIVSVNISDWTTPGSKGVPARRVVDPSEVAEETWRQLVAHLPGLAGHEPYRSEATWNLDPAIIDPDEIGPNPPGASLETRIGEKGGAQVLRNTEQLLINTEGSWRHRPCATTAVPNLAMAGDFVRTHSDFASMESANESGRWAARAVMDYAESAGGERHPRPEVYALDHPDSTRWIVRLLKSLDRVGYALGLPHPGEVLAGPAALLAAMCNALPFCGRKR